MSGQKALNSSWGERRKGLSNIVYEQKKKAKGTGIGTNEEDRYSK